MDSQGTPKKVCHALRHNLFESSPISLLFESSPISIDTFHSPSGLFANDLASPRCVGTGSSCGWTHTPSETSLSDIEWESPVKRHHGSGELEEPLVQLEQEGRNEVVYWESVVVVIPMFAGYGTLVGLQHVIKVALGVPDDSSAASHSFGVATSMLYVFNLLLRFLHNAIFGCLSPRQRVFVSMVSMVLSLTVIVFALKYLESKSLAWIALAYSLGGVAVGTFEGNFLNCLTPLGQGTKKLAIAGIPFGMSAVLIGGFLAMTPPVNLAPSSIFVMVICALLLGMACMKFRIPDSLSDDAETPATCRKMLSDLRQFKSWMPILSFYPLASTVDMFALSCFAPGVVLQMYNQPMVTLANDWSVRSEDFIALFNVMSLLGSFVGRVSSFTVKQRHPLCYTLFTGAGISMILVQVPTLAPLGALLIMLGNGLIYGTISRHIDACIPREFNLIAISCWLCIGDLGSVIGSNVVSYIRDLVAGQETI